MQIDRDKFVCIIQARKEFNSQYTSKNKQKMMSAFKKRVLGFIESTNMPYYYIPHDSNTSTPAKFYIPKEYVKVFLHNKEAQQNKICKYELLTINTTGKSFSDTLKELGISYSTFRKRISSGWSFASATTLDKGGYTEASRKRHNKRDIAKHVAQSRAKRHR